MAVNLLEKMKAAAKAGAKSGVKTAVPVSGAKAGVTGAVKALPKINPVTPPSQYTPPVSPPTATSETPIISGIDFTPEQQSKLAVTAQEFGLPENAMEELNFLKKTFTSQELAQMGIDENKLIESATKTQAAASAFEATPKPTTTGLFVLQQALQKKADLANAPSEVEAAMAEQGITGYAALPGILTAKGQELDAKITELQNKLLTQGGKEADVYNAALDKYKILSEDYYKAKDRLDTVVDKAMAYDQEVKLMEKKQQLDKEMEDYKQKYPGASVLLSGKEAGLEWVDGKWQSPSLASALAQDEPQRFAKWKAKGPNLRECGEGFNNYTDGVKVTDSWTSKINGTTHNAPNIGNGLALLIGDPANGHIGTVVSYDATTGTVETVEWNKHGNGQQSFEKYILKGDTLTDLSNNQVFTGKQFGFNNNTFKQKYLNNLEEISSGTNKYEEIAQDIMAGNSKLTLKDLPQKERAAVDAELNKLKAQALAAGDFEGVMKASAGGSNPGDTFKVAMKKGKTVITQLSMLSALMLKNKTTNKDTGESIDLSPLSGWLKKKNPWDTDAQTIQSIIQATIPNLARGVYGEVGVLTDNDVALYAKTIPNLTSTEDVQKAVLAATLITIRDSLKTQIEVEAASGSDMSGFVQFYKEIDDTIKNLETDIGIDREKGKSSFKPINFVLNLLTPDQLIQLYTNPAHSQAAEVANKYNLKY